MAKSKTVTGLFWSFTDNFSQQLINFIVGIILARILLPEEFGVVGIVLGFIALSNVFVDAGLSDALINRAETRTDDYHTVFWANITIGVVFCAFLFLIAPTIAHFFGQVELKSLIRIGSFSVIISSLSSVQRAIYTKKIDFKPITLISLVSATISGTIAIIMALRGWGAISLIIRQLIGQAATTIMFYILSSWRPQLRFNSVAFKEMFSYGINIFFSKLVNTLYNYFNYFVIGKWFSPTQLGYYTRADTFKSLASTNLSNIVNKVSFATLSAKDKIDSQTKSFVLFFKGTGLLTSFLMAILFSCAEPIITLLLGNNWIQSIEYLKLLTFSGMFIPIYMLNLNFLGAIREIKKYFYTELITKSALIPFSIMGLFLGMKWFLWLIAIHALLSYIFAAYRVSKVSNLTLFKQLKEVVIIIVPFILAIASSTFLDYLLIEKSIYLQGTVNFIIVCALYITTIILWRKRYKQIVEIAINNISKIK